MPIFVNLPDGSRASFPDGTTPDVMKAAIQKKFPPSGPPAGATPGSRGYADWAAAQARAGKPLPQVSQEAPKANTSPVDQVLAGYTSAVDQIPIAGPFLKSGLEKAKAGIYGVPQQQIAQEDQARQDANPTASTVGAVAGNVLPFVAGGEIPIVAKALGMETSMPMLARAGASMLSNAGLSAGDTAVRGGDAGDIARSAAIGGVTGALLPKVGDLLAKGTGAVTKKIADATTALRNPEAAAQRMVSRTAAKDATAGPGVMSPADEAAAALNNQPIVNADRFGEGTRTLARTAINSNPSAGEALKAATQDRFLTQNTRAVDFVKRITGGATDDLALQDSIQSAAKASNSAAYGKAYGDPAAQVVWTPEIKQLFQSPDFLKAIRGAEGTAANDAATSGQKAVKSPFVFDQNGNIGLRKNPNGSTALPSLQFWDIVQRNLRRQSEMAYRGGDNLLGSQLGDMRKQLLGSLDSAVPSFQAARQGAAKAFGAEDALDAGRKFVDQRMGIPEATRAHAQFSPSEKKAFGVGYASSLIDKINAASDRVNVINQVFGSPASRAQVELALGKHASKELEHFVRVEDIMQATKQGVQGNSSTVKQLAAMGALGGLGGGIFGGWDYRNVATGAGLMMAGRMGARALGNAVDQKVMAHVAEILASNDPKAINRVVLNAAMNPKQSAAIKAIQMGLSAASRGALVNATRAPLQITVNGGAAAPAY